MASISETLTKKPKQSRFRKFQHDDKAASCSNVVEGTSNSVNIFNIKAVPVVEAKGVVFRIKKNGCKHINLQYSQMANQSNEDKKSNDTPPSSVRNSFSTQFSNETKPSTSGLQSNGENSEGITKILQKPPKYNATKKEKKKKFLPYMNMQDVFKGLELGKLVKGIVRINAKNFREAYVSNEDCSQQDYFIQNVIDRNRALEGDVVVIKINPQSEWTEKLKTAVVVHILEKVHPRMTVGILKPMIEGNQDFAVLVPRDSRIPRLKIPLSACPIVFLQNPKRYENMLFKAKICCWKDVKYPIGELMENIGCIGDLESETEALLNENCLDVTPFPENILSDILFDSISPDEIELREDLRGDCIFTIDPATARDLDDAVSCKELPNGNLEVGVHISDVSHYLKNDTELDRLVSKKATTIYLVNDVFHMLPRELCMHCSLLPGEDKRAFSVFWEMTTGGDILSYRFARTIINSCVQLSYEHAQIMIENPNYKFTPDELPKIFGNFTHKDLSKTVNSLQKIACHLRKLRFDKGSLRIDQTKLSFKLDPTTGKPTEYFIYENKESHRLIEEFMLLANIFVAQKTRGSFPDIAFLRNHNPPNQFILKDLVKTLQEFNIDLNISSSKSIQMSLTKAKDEKHMSKAGMMAINHLLAKPMRRALYFCSSNAMDEENFHHYALNVPIYTHFTSPIRRYADIMVHRLLAASLGYEPKPLWNAVHVSSIANNCNIQKQNAKLAGEASSELYLAQYVANNQPFIRDAIVVDVKNSSFEIIVIEVGVVLRIFSKNLDKGIQYIEENRANSKHHLLVFPETTEFSKEIHAVKLFSTVKVNLCRKPKTNKLEAKLIRPSSTAKKC